MSLTAHAYTKVADSLASKKITIATDSIKCMLLSAYTVGTTQDTAQYLADVLAVATEASGTGYTAGGAALTGGSWSESGHVYTYTGTIPAWNAAGGTLAASYAVFYDATPGTNATNPVLCYWDFGGVNTATNGTFTLTANASGILTITGS
jgi:hypothetical protein